MQITQDRETVNADSVHVEERFLDDWDACILEPLTELPDGAFPVVNRIVTVPHVQSMKDYINLHYKKSLMKSLCRWLAGGEPDAFRPGASVVVRPEPCRITHITFWRAASFILTARICMSVDVIVIAGGIERTEHRSFWTEVLFDVEEGIAWHDGSFTQYPDDAPNGWELNDYLIPVLRKQKIEEGAEALLKEFCPEALADLKQNDALILARRMGLQVVELPLYKRNRTRSMLFFCEGKVAIKEKEAQEKARPEVVLVPGKTIVINTNAVYKGRYQMDVYHECIHYDWHFMFHRLQEMHNNDVRQLKLKWKVERNRKHCKTLLKWMEWQARRGGYGLMMPLSVMKPLVQGKLEALQNGRCHMGERLDVAARRIAHEYELPKYRVRARLIQMGHIAAKGALNYIDGRYIAPFLFSPDNGSNDYTFVVDREGAFAEYERNAEFRERIDTGRYVFADGHICLHDPQYVTHTERGLRLTRWANEHVDRCCLRFISVYEQNEASEYRYGALNSDEEYNRHYLTFPDENQTLTKMERLAKMTQILSDLPASFHETLEYLMRKRKMTIEQLEAKAHLSTRTISRLRAEERREYSLDQVIAICVALNLPPWLGSVGARGFHAQEHPAAQGIPLCAGLSVHGYHR